jgi:predicted amidohydrolase
MSRTITAAVIQTAAHDRTSLSHAWPAIAARVRAAAAQGAQLLVLPEGTLPAYVLGYETFSEAEIAEALAECAAIAKEHGSVIVIGTARREGERVYNSALIIDADGTVAGSGDKHFLWHFDRQWFAPGEQLQPVQTAAGTIGALVCADGRIPTIARTLVDRGAQLLVMPTAWVTSGRDPQNLENVQADLLARVRARENGVPFLAANKCGVERGCVAYCGKSQIVNADGSIAALAPQDAQTTLFAEIALETPQANRAPAQDLPAADAPREALRLAITARARCEEDAEALRILEADALIGPAGAWPAGRIAYPIVDDGTVLDPGGLAQLRLAGGTFAVWKTSYDPQWQVTFARTRALELRMYFVVIDESRRRAYAVDPDGTVICGTFDGYEIASFAYDPARTEQTFVAPGTDVREGLRRAALHAAP